MNLKELGRNCQRWRKSQNIKQSELANDCGVSRESISAFENGRSRNVEILGAYIDRGFEYGKAKKC